MTRPHEQRSNRQRSALGSLAVLLCAGCGVFEFRTPVDVDTLPEDMATALSDECQRAKPGESYIQQYCWDGRKQGALLPSCTTYTGTWGAPSMGTWGPKGTPSKAGNIWKCTLASVLQPTPSLAGQQVVVRMEHQRNIPLGWSGPDLKPAHKVSIDIYGNSDNSDYSLAVWQSSPLGYVADELSVVVPAPPASTSVALAPALRVETSLESISGFSWQIRHLSIWTKSETKP